MFSLYSDIDSLRISLKQQPPAEENNCFSRLKESRLKKNGTPNVTDEITTLVRTPSTDKLHPSIDKTSGELGLCTSSRYADTVIGTFTYPLMSSNPSMRQNDDLAPNQPHGETTETSNANKMPAVRSEEVAPKCEYAQSDLLKAFGHFETIRIAEILHSSSRIFHTLMDGLEEKNSLLYNYCTLYSTVFIAVYLFTIKGEYGDN